METSAEIKDLAEALAKVQAEIKNVAKTGQGNFGKYAELAPTLEHVLPILSKQGLSVSQMPVQLDDSTTGLTTLLLHSSGQWIKSTFPVRMQQQTPQGQGSAITYARRYALTAMIGVAGDDDDGQAGSEGKNPEVKRVRSATPPTPVNVAAPKPAMVTQAQLAIMFAAMKGKGFHDRDVVKDVLHNLADVTSLTALTKQAASKLIEQLKDESLDKAMLDSLKTPSAVTGAE